LIAFSAGVQLLRRRLARQERQVHLLDDLAGVLLLAEQVGEAVAAVGHRLADHRAVHQVQHRPELHAADPLALAGALARRLAEQVEEPARHVLRRVEQLRRPRPGRQARQPRR